MIRTEFPKGYTKYNHPCETCGKNVLNKPGYIIIQNDTIEGFQEGDTFYRLPNRGYCNKKCLEKDK